MPRLPDLEPEDQPEKPRRRGRRVRPLDGSEEPPVLPGWLVADMQATMLELDAMTPQLLHSRSAQAQSSLCALASLHRFFVVHESDDELYACSVCGPRA